MLNDTLVKLHAKYQETHKSTVGYTSFRTLRPDNYILVDKSKLQMCLCEICENTRLKLEALKKFKKDVHLSIEPNPEALC